MNIQLRPHQKRGLDAMIEHLKGQLIMPTGAGKTLTMISDTVKEFSNEIPQTIVIVAPRILLATQLCSEFLEFITNAEVLHCHSGEVHWESSTRPREIRRRCDANADNHRLIVTTYNSLSRLQVAEIDADTIYFDEAHNSVQRHFFPATEHFAVCLCVLLACGLVPICVDCLLVLLVCFACLILC